MVDTLNVDPKIGQMYKDFEDGMYLMRGQETMIANFKIAGTLPKTVVDTSQVTIYESDSLDDYMKKVPKGKKFAKGASGRKFRGSVKSSEGYKLESREVEYTINNEDMLHPSFNLDNEIRKMSYILADDIDEIVLNTVRENARTIIPSGSATTGNKIVGKWDTADMDSILGDIIRIKKQLRDKNIGALDTFMYGDEAQTQVATKCQVLSEKYQFPTTGFYVDDNIRLSNANHMWGGDKELDEELFAFKSSIPPMQLIYKKYNNPNIKSVPTIQGLEYITPTIEMLMFDNGKENLNPQTTIKMGVTCGALPISKGNNMVRIANILS